MFEGSPDERNVNLLGDESSYSINEDYLKEVNDAVNNTMNFESIEVRVSSGSRTHLLDDAFFSGEGAEIFLISKNPNMGYSFITLENNSLIPVYIFIEDEGVEGHINPVYDDTHTRVGSEINEEVDITAFSENGKMNESFTGSIYITHLEELSSDTKYIDSIKKEGNVYSIVLNDEYFEYKNSLFLEYMDEVSLEILESREGEWGIYQVTIEDGIVTYISIVEYAFAKQYVHEQKLFSAEINYVSDNRVNEYYGFDIQILRYNDNENIINEINKAYEDIAIS